MLPPSDLKAGVLLECEVIAAFVIRQVFADEIGCGERGLDIAKFVNLSAVNVAAFRSQGWRAARVRGDCCLRNTSGLRGRNRLRRTRPRHRQIRKSERGECCRLPISRLACCSSAR